MKKSRSAAAESTYHHGDLRAALLSAAREIVIEQGVSELSLRAVSRRAGVSHSAPYHHFPDKAALFAALAAVGYDQLVAEIERAQQKLAADDYLGRVMAVGSTYVQFALQNPAIFRLMFRPELTLPAKHNELRAAETRAFGALVAALAECQTRGLVPGTDPLPAAMSCWSTVHGFAILWIDQVTVETPLGERPLAQLAEHVLQTITHGVAAYQPEPAKPTRRLLKRP